MTGADICFLATSKSGLGHLRRSATIAARIRQHSSRRMHLVSNAAPQGISAGDLSAFTSIHILDRSRMAADLAIKGPKVMVLDTLTVPGITDLDAPLALVLREAPANELHRFRLPGARPWDLAVIANPITHWMPSPSDLQARQTEAVGWIYRRPGLRQAVADRLPTVLVATGGGGTSETAAALMAEIDPMIAWARQIAPPFQVVQAIGPRAATFGRLAGADRILDPGPDLNTAFRDADIVISTAGYNSVLELALTDTPTILMPIPRSIDDQVARARLWGPQLGAWHDSAAPGLSALWLSHQIATRQRRAPIDLGPSGEDRAARAILQLG